jgi:hypothetical protein
MKSQCTGATRGIEHMLEAMEAEQLLFFIQQTPTKSLLLPGIGYLSHIKYSSILLPETQSPVRERNKSDVNHSVLSAIVEEMQAATGSLHARCSGQLSINLSVCALTHVHWCQSSQYGLGELQQG